MKEAVAEQEIITPLSLEERSALRDLETEIEQGMNGFIQVGVALKKIRDERLYRAEHKTFEVYVQKRWKFTTRRAYQIIDSAQMAMNPECETLFQKEDQPKERAALELAKVPEEELPTVVRKLEKVQAVTGKPITSGDVQRAVAPKPERKPDPRDYHGRLNQIDHDLHNRQINPKEARERRTEVLHDWYQSNRLRLYEYPQSPPEGVFKDIVKLFA